MPSVTIREDVSLKSYLFKPSNVRKIVFVGDKCSGKSSIIKQFFKKTFDKVYFPTIGIDFGRKSVGSQVLDIWDLSGSSIYSEARLGVYDNDIDTLVICVELNRLSVDEVRKWITEVKHYTNCIVLGTKSDIKSRTCNRSVIDQICSEFGSSYLETSAKEDLNINELFKILIN